MAAAPSPHPAHPPEAQQHFQPHCALLQNQASPASEYRAKEAKEAKEEVRSPQADLKNKLQLPMLLLLSGSPVSPRILMKGLRAGGSLSLFSTCNSQPKSPCLLPQARCLLCSQAYHAAALLLNATGWLLLHAAAKLETPKLAGNTEAGEQAPLPPGDNGRSHQQTTSPGHSAAPWC